MKCLVVAVVLALGATANQQKFSKDDLRKALDTEEKLWTVMRNFTRGDESGQVSCIYDEKVSLEHDKYIFDHHFKVAGDWIKVPLYGTLQDEDEGGVLSIAEKKGGQGNRHVLRSWNEKYKCFILTHKNTTTNVEQCSLHVPDSIVDSESSAGGLECKKLYEETCKEGTHYSIYTKKCREGLP
uniref:Putative lipocalin-2 1 n=1 Tax=Amblyomma triste TaxID=251400 RepID=A0A023GAA4_AMBTT